MCVKWGCGGVGREGCTYCILALIRMTAAVNVRLPKANSELSSVKSACPYNPSMQKYTTMASADAINIHPR